MKSLVVKLIIVIVVILLLGSVGYTVLHLQSIQEQYTEQAHRHFSNMVEETALLYRGDGERKVLFSQFKAKLREYEKLRSYIISDTDGELHYVYGRNPSALSFTDPREEQLERSDVRQFERPRFDTSISTSVPMGSANPYSLNVFAVYETLSHAALRESIRFLLLTLTGLLLILGTALILLPASHVPQTAAPESFYTDKSGIPQVPEEYFRPAPAGFPRYSRKQQNESPQESADSATEEPAQDYEQTDSNSDTELEGEGENSFFSTKSQLVRGDFFLSRLESELKRAASFDQDLTLLLFRCPDTHTTETFMSLAEKSKAFFTFHDLLFELSEYTIGVILPNTDLDEGIMQSSNFQKKLFEEGDARTADVRLGLSSRNGRLVEAERIYGEAQMALYKAQHDPDHPSITGFRPDPNKYRLYLSGKR